MNFIFRQAIYERREKSICGKYFGCIPTSFHPNNDWDYLDILSQGFLLLFGLTNSLVESCSCSILFVF